MYIHGAIALDFGRLVDITDANTHAKFCISQFRVSEF